MIKKARAIEQLRAVEQRILPKNQELSKLLISISEKEKRFEEEEK
jgi:hypothetical protein